MEKQIWDILEGQEQREKKAYQFSRSIREMIQADFANSEEVLEALSGWSRNLAVIFRSGSLTSLGEQGPVPVRSCNTFQISKHTLSQVPYLHTHSFYELIYVLRGRCRQTVKEEGRFRSLVLESHQACLLPPGAVHSMERCGTEDVILKCSIPSWLYRETGMPVLPPETKNRVSVFSSHGVRTEMLTGILVKEMADCSAFWETVVKNTLSLLFVQFSRDLASPETGIIRRLFRWLEETAGQPSLEAFAKAEGYSADYVGKLIKGNMGRSFRELATESRQKKAARMLLDTDNSVAEVAEQLGYVSVSGLYRQFSRQFGMTPGEYRRTFQERFLPGQESMQEGSVCYNGSEISRQKGREGIEKQNKNASVRGQNHRTGQDKSGKGL